MQEIAQLEKISTEADFWSNNQEAQVVLRRLKELKQIVQPWQKAFNDIKDFCELYSLCQESGDDAMMKELIPQIGSLTQEVEQLEFVRKMSGEDDTLPAIFSIHSGAGGTESCDWCECCFACTVGFLSTKDSLIRFWIYYRETSRALKVLP